MKLGPPPLSIRTRLTLWYTGMLLLTLLVISVLSYSMLRWSLIQDLDASLLTVAHVIRDLGVTDVRLGSDPESQLRDILGPELYDKFFQLLDPEGRPGARSAKLGGRTLPLSPRARQNAAGGEPTFETVRLGDDTRVRLLTLPVRGAGDAPELIQVGIPLQRAEAALTRYLQILLVLVPFALALAATGGAVIARTALRPVGTMSRTARRITGEDLARRIPMRGTGDELDDLAETLNRMLERLDETFAQMRRFTADASHELRTPLTALKGGIEVALRSERTAEDYRRVLRSSLEEVDRLIRLAEDLLLLSRANAGLDARSVAVELEPLMLDVLDVGTRLAQRTGVAVRLKEAAAVTVQGDASALRRAVLNLVENAVKYSPSGHTVELSLTVDADHVIIVVTDEGIGIEPGDAERIFEPFVRLDAARARDTGGSGLGLAIARSIVHAHRGTLAVQSAVGRGSRFEIRLPLP
jgi:two-component system OmpR family sensor kinase